MHQALEKACCTVASLCSGPETGVVRKVRIKKTIGKADFIFLRGSFSLIWWVCHPGYQVSVALCDLFWFFLNKLAIVFALVPLNK